MYEEVTFEEIMERMLDRVPDEFDKREGSIIYDALAPAAAELAQMYIELDTIIDLSFADTSSGDYLDRRCMERGIIRNSATKARLKGVFVPSTVEIPIGTLFSCEDLNYEIVEKLSDGVYELECDAEGKIGNTIFGQLIPVDYIEELETAELTELLIPGEDEENDDDLRERYLNTFDSKAYGGNVEDYLNKTNSIHGVGSTKVTPVWNGGGTVKLTILDSDFNKATNKLVETVQNTIDPTQDATGVGLAPIGHIVTVDTVIEKVVNISSSISFDVGYTFDSLKAEIEDSIKTYLLETRKMWAAEQNSVVRISQIESRIMKIEGVVDIGNTKINGVGANLICGSYEVPIFGGVVND